MSLAERGGWLLIGLLVCGWVAFWQSTGGLWYGCWVGVNVGNGIGGTVEAGGPGFGLFQRAADVNADQLILEAGDQITKRSEVPT